MESVIKQLDKFISHLESDIKGIEQQIGDTKDQLHFLHRRKNELETKMLETARALDFLKANREVNEIAVQ